MCSGLGKDGKPLAGDSGSSSMSTETIIIIAACAGGGLLLIAAFAAFLLSRRKHSEHKRNVSGMSINASHTKTSSVAFTSSRL